MTIASCLSPETRREDAEDDHLARLLDLFSDVFGGPASSKMHSNPLLAHALKPRFHQVDSISTSGYGHVSGEGLCRYGPGQDHRPNMPQVNIGLAVPNPLGLPLVTQVVHGDSNDDPLQVPAIHQAHPCSSEHGLTHFGESRMGALETRAHIQRSGDCSLMPDLPPRDRSSF